MLEHLLIPVGKQVSETGRSRQGSQVGGGHLNMVPLGLVEHAGPEGKRASARSGLKELL